VKLVSKEALTIEKRSRSEPTIEYGTLFHRLQTTTQSQTWDLLIEQVMDQDHLLFSLVDVQSPVHGRGYGGHFGSPTAWLRPPKRETGP
jgi:hypothetical protein